MTKDKQQIAILFNGKVLAITEDVTFAQAFKKCTYGVELTCEFEIQRRNYE